MSTNSATIIPQPSFYGDYEKGEEPTNWIRKYQLSLPTSHTDAEKIARFELQCAAASPAEHWFANLATADKTSWTTFLAAFRVRWPPPAPVTLTVAQKKERIKALVLKEEEIGVMIEEDRGREWGHVKWAKTVSRMAQGFSDTQCHLLDIVLENTPEVLRDFLTDNYSSWADFEADVAKVSASQLLKAKQRLTMERKLREDVDKLQSQANSGRKTTSPSLAQSQQTPYTSSPTYRYGYRYNNSTAMNNQIQPAAPPATFQNLAPPQVPQTPQASNPFAPPAPVTRGNLFYGYRGYPQTPTRNRGGSPADRARTAAQYATIPHHADSEAGRQAYDRQIQEWHAQHGAETTPNSQKPYPLKPGTAPIGSRECFSCGMATSPPHQSYDCPNQPLPPQETKWRETVSRLVSRTLASATTPGPTTNVQFVTPAAGPTNNVHYAVPQPMGYPQYSYYTEPYDVYNIAGNEYGPQQ